jgi:hypothetical protein
MSKQNNSLPLFEVNNFDEVQEWLPFDIENAPDAISGRCLLVQRVDDLDYYPNLCTFCSYKNEWFDFRGDSIKRYVFDYLTTYRLIKL